MKKTSFRIMCLLLMVVFALTAVTACGNKAGQEQDTAKTVEKAAEATKTETNEVKPVKFSIQVCQPDPAKDFADLFLPAQEYMKKNPNVTIELIGTPHDEHKKKIDMMAQSNSLPDVFWNTNADSAEIVKMGVIADLTDDLKNDAEFSGSINPGALDNFTFDGRIYAIPEKTDVMGFFYNKAIFSKLNLKIPETWDELLNAITVLNKNGIVPIAQGTKDTWSVWGYYLLFDRYGWADFMPKYLAKEQKMEGSDMQKVFVRLQELAKAGAFPKNLTTVDYTQMKEMFLGGKAAIYQTGSWQVGDLEKSSIAKDLDFNWGPLLQDGIADQKLGLKETTSGLWISANAKKDADKFKAIMGFLKYRASPEGTTIVVEKANYIPSTKYTGDGATLGPVFKLVVSKLNDEYKARPEVPILMPPSFMQPLWNAMTGVMNGIMTPEQACKSLDDWNASR